MDETDKELIIAILDLMLSVGVPSVIKAIQQFQISNDPTVEEIKRLNDILNPSDSYWEKE